MEKASERSEKARAGWERNREEKARLGVPTCGTKLVRVYAEDVEVLRRFGIKSPRAIHALIVGAALLRWEWDMAKDCRVASLPTEGNPGGLPPPKRFPPATPTA